MMNPFEYEREIDEIRAALYLEAKATPQAERIRKANELIHALAQQYGFRVVPSATEPQQRPA